MIKILTIKTKNIMSRPQCKSEIEFKLFSFVIANELIYTYNKDFTKLNLSIPHEHLHTFNQIINFDYACCCILKSDCILLDISTILKKFEIEISTFLESE